MATEEELLTKFLDPLKVCKRYKPKFGQGNKEEGVSLERFPDLYGADPFYAWCGLDSELMYAAHKAAGGMTSVYRQIGKGCENLFREVIITTTGYAQPRQCRMVLHDKDGRGQRQDPVPGRADRVQ